MWYLIYAVVPSGKAGEVIRLTEQVGSQSGTLIQGKGIGTPSKLFLNFEVEPMREIIWIIVEKDKYKEVNQIIFQNMDLDKEGNGILFVELFSEVHGLVIQLPSE